MKSHFLPIAFLVASSLSALSAQTPSINSGGIGMANGSSPLHFYYYWSIYGSNLSTGSGSTVYRTVQEWDYNTNTYYYQTLPFSSVQQNPGYWFESGSQINFYSDVWNDPPYYITGNGYLRVCKSGGLCSGYENFNAY